MKSSNGILVIGSSIINPTMISTAAIRMTISVNVFFFLFHLFASFLICCMCRFRFGGSLQIPERQGRILLPEQGLRPLVKAAHN